MLFREIPRNPKQSPNLSFQIPIFLQCPNMGLPDHSTFESNGRQNYLFRDWRYSSNTPLSEIIIGYLCDKCKQGHFKAPYSRFTAYPSPPPPVHYQTRKPPPDGLYKAVAGVILRSVKYRCAAPQTLRGLYREASVSLWELCRIPFRRHQEFCAGRIFQRVFAYARLLATVGFGL